MPSIEGGGVEKNLFLITNYLSGKFSSLSVISISKKYKKKFNKKINFITLKSKFWDTLGRRKKYFLSLYLLINEYLKNRNFIVFCFQANIYCTLLCKFLNIKIIVRSNSSPSGWSKNPLKKIIFEKILKMANNIIVNSLEFKKELKKKFNVNSICIYNPLNKYEILKLSKKKTSDAFFEKKNLNLINVGRLVDQKDQLTILKSMQILNKENFNFKLLIIGSGILKKKLANFINKNNLNNKIKIKKFTNNPFPYIAKADIFILSSIFEGLPNVLLEALTLKKFIISTSCPTGPNEILDYGKGGTLFKPGDHIDLAKKIKSFSKNKLKNKKKLSYSLKRLSRFNFDKNLKKYYKVLIQV